MMEIDGCRNRNKHLFGEGEKVVVLLKLYQTVVLLSLGIQ